MINLSRFQLRQKKVCEIMIRHSETLLTLLCLELVEFKQRRVVAFKKNLIEVAELEVKHAKVSFKVLPRFY